jgi:hypothetical protein
MVRAWNSGTNLRIQTGFFFADQIDYGLAKLNGFEEI